VRLADVRRGGTRQHRIGLSNATLRVPEASSVLVMAVSMTEMRKRAQ
jgi:hypothetical protein